MSSKQQIQQYLLKFKHECVTCVQWIILKSVQVRVCFLPISWMMIMWVASGVSKMSYVTERHGIRDLWDKVNQAHQVPSATKWIQAFHCFLKMCVLLSSWFHRIKQRTNMKHLSNKVLKTRCLAQISRITWSYPGGSEKSWMTWMVFQHALTDTLLLKLWPSGNSCLVSWLTRG